MLKKSDEILIKGSEVKDEQTVTSQLTFCDFCVSVKKGNSECGDSAFVYYDKNKLIAGVFDGVSGEPDAALASSVAAANILESLRAHDHATEKLLEDALVHSHTKIKKGFTTGSIVFLEKDGTVTIAGVGDSPIYTITGDSIYSELHLARVVRNGDSILKFLSSRHMITSFIGPSNNDIIVCTKSGKLAKDEKLIIATDGLLDNLYVGVHDGYITDSLGLVDLKNILPKEGSSENIVRSLMVDITKRISAGKIEHKDRLLHPKDDDISIICIGFK